MLETTRNRTACIESRYGDGDSGMSRMIAKRQALTGDASHRVLLNGRTYFDRLSQLSV